MSKQLVIEQFRSIDEACAEKIEQILNDQVQNLLEGVLRWNWCPERPKEGISDIFETLVNYFSGTVNVIHLVNKELCQPCMYMAFKLTN